MVAYTKPQQSKKEGSERLRGEGDQTKFIGRVRVINIERFEPTPIGL